MCLIAVADTSRLTHEEIADAARYNADGIGVAYMEPGDRLVSYQKGLSVGEAQFLADKMPLPHVMHFRMATHGGDSPLLCHPFPVTRNVGVKLEGQAKELLFHNGVWMEHELFQHEVRFTGPVSDTRILAYVLWREGQTERTSVATFLSKQAGKLALVTKEGITRYGDWDEGDGLDSTPGCWYSNLHHTWASQRAAIWLSQREAISYPLNGTKTLAPGWNYMDRDAWELDSLYPDLVSPEVTVELNDDTPDTFTCGGCERRLDICEQEPHALIDGSEVCRACWVTLF